MQRIIENLNADWIYIPRDFKAAAKKVCPEGTFTSVCLPHTNIELPRKDADIIKFDLACNIVRTSHYPQSPYFLDRCDEIGLLVLEEIPGWQHIGEDAWKQISLLEDGRQSRWRR